MRGIAAFDFDPWLVEAWLNARSIARGLPPPVPDRGGLKVDTKSDKEICRWVFPRMVGGLSELAKEIAEPRHFLKLCDSAEQLTATVPPRWELQPPGYMMMAATCWHEPISVPKPYELQVEQCGAVTSVTIVAPDGSLAARGYAAETADAFVYDRIETDLVHRRRGLARCIMAALAAAKKSDATPEVLVATEDGRKLYDSLGWRVCSPYSTVTIPLAHEP